MKVAVIGSGLMGKGLTQIFAQCSEISRVFWVGRNSSTLNDGLERVKQIWAKLEKKGQISSFQKAQYCEKILLETDKQCLKDADFILEAVIENIEVKKEVFFEISKFSKPEAILASNSSSLSITEIAGVTKFPENVLGLHFFNPPAVMQLTEIVVGMKTSQSTISSAQVLVGHLGKESILVKESPGFIVNRMLIPMINEAVGLLAENIAEAKEIDKAMRLGANHPIGPLALADLIGNDVVLAIMETLRRETGDPKYRAHPLLRKMVRANFLGRKTGKGFYLY